MAQAGPDKEGVHNILDKTAFEDALSQPGLMVVDAFATWCGPCKVIAPKIVEFSKKYEDVRFYKFDTDELEELAAELDVRAMPTFYFFKDGEKVANVVGANPKLIENAIKEHSKPGGDSTSKEPASVSKASGVSVTGSETTEASESTGTTETSQLSDAAESISTTTGTETTLESASAPSVNTTQSAP